MRPPVPYTGCRRRASEGRPVRRRGFSALLLVMGAAFLMMIWAASQHLATGTIHKKVVIAEASRHALDRASAAVDEAVKYLWIASNEPSPEGSGEGRLAQALRELTPDEDLEFTYRPVLAALPGGTVPLEVSDVTVRAYLRRVDESEGDRADDFCEKLEEWAEKWSQVPG